MRSAIIIVITIIAVGVGAYCYWIGSPFYAFQQAAMAAKDHDGALFDKYVDAGNIVDHSLDDLLVQPALSTPGLSTFQTTVASGALTMAKASVTKGLLESINRYFSEGNVERQRNKGYVQNFACPAAIAAPAESTTTAEQSTANAERSTANAGQPKATPGDSTPSDQNLPPTRIAEAGSTGEGLKALFHAASHEMSGEVSKLKSVAFNRMLAYIQNHPNTVPGRLLNCPPGERSAHAREMLEEYGLTAKNFKGLAGCVTTSDILGRQSSTVGFNFFSPKISRQVVVEVELKKDTSTGVWRINRLSNIIDVMDQVEEYYDRDIHELVEYSLSGMSNSNMATDMRGMTERIKQNPAAQNLLKKWNLNLR